MGVPALACEVNEHRNSDRALPGPGSEVSRGNSGDPLRADTPTRVKRPAPSLWRVKGSFVVAAERPCLCLHIGGAW